MAKPRNLTPEIFVLRFNRAPLDWRTFVELAMDVEGDVGDAARLLRASENAFEMALKSIGYQHYTGDDTPEETVK